MEEMPRYIAVSLASLVVGIGVFMAGILVGGGERAVLGIALATLGIGIIGGSLALDVMMMGRRRRP